MERSFEGGTAAFRALRRTPVVVLMAFIAAAAMMTGCGWRFADRTEAIPTELVTVAIPLWKNDTAEPGLSTIFTNATIKEFATKGWLRPVAAEKSADTVLEGRIEFIDVQPLSFSSVAIELENRVTISASVTLRRRDDQSVLWSASRLVGQEEYDSTPDFNVNLRNREQALRKVATDLAGTIHDEVFRIY